MQNTNLIQKICRTALIYSYGLLLIYFAAYLAGIIFNYNLMHNISIGILVYSMGIVLQFFGWGSIWIILLLFLGGLRALFCRKIKFSVFAFLFIILFTGSLCLLLSLLLSDIAKGGGGYFGDIIKDFASYSYLNFFWQIFISLSLIFLLCCLVLFCINPRVNIKKKKASNIVQQNNREKKSTKIAHKNPPKQSVEIKNFVHSLPSLEILKQSDSRFLKKVSENSLQRNTALLLKIFQDFGVKGVVESVKPGPVVTLYELELAAGIKSSRVIGLADDVARSMSAISTRIAVIPGKSTMGIELPNKNREIVFLQDFLQNTDYARTAFRLPLALGKTIAGDAVIADLADMPHLLVAGTTGSGKSVAINAMILSILYKLTPEQCKMILIDPKMLELSAYSGIPHLMAPVVTEAKEAVVALKWVVKEMEDRYCLISKMGARNITSYNEKLKIIQDSDNSIRNHLQDNDIKPMPFIVVVVDEMADLMLVAGKDIEVSVQRLAQMARAAGIHIIMATQRPSVDVITGVIKANFPTRISFAVTSRTDSRTILGEQGAENLLGMGDMLYMSGGDKIKRLHGPFVSDEEVEKVVSFLKTQGEPEYVSSVTDFEDNQVAHNLEQDEDLYSKAIRIILRDKKVSISYIQRQLRIGYNRAAILVEKMEQEKIVSPPNHAGKRTILISQYPEE